MPSIRGVLIGVGFACYAVSFILPAYDFGKGDLLSGSIRGFHAALFMYALGLRSLLSELPMSLWFASLFLVNCVVVAVGAAEYWSVQSLLRVLRIALSGACVVSWTPWMYCLRRRCVHALREGYYLWAIAVTILTWPAWR